jgi:hypothetical protein
VWLEVAPGTTLKMLRVDPETGERTGLMRMEPGSVYPEHDHPVPEECNCSKASSTSMARIIGLAITRLLTPAVAMR